MTVRAKLEKKNNLIMKLAFTTDEIEAKGLWKTIAALENEIRAMTMN